MTAAVRRARRGAKKRRGVAPGEGARNWNDVDVGSREPYNDAALYDYEYRNRRDDIGFYRRLANAYGGPILELGAGSGRVTIALARDGHEVVALDTARTMLRQLRSKVASLPPAAAARVAVVNADLRTFDIGAALGRDTVPRFPLVIAAFNVLEHLYTRGEVAACLARVSRHLAPGGRFAFDVQVPEPRWLARDSTKRWAKTRFTHPVTKRQMIYSTSHDYDPIGQIANIRFYYESAKGPSSGTSKGPPRPTRVVRLSQRKFFPAELEALLAHAGFRAAERYGDFAGTPLGRQSRSQVLICQLSAAARPG